MKPLWMESFLKCPDCGAPLQITTKPANGWNEWDVQCSIKPYEHGPSVYDWPMEPVVIPAISATAETSDGPTPDPKPSGSGARGMSEDGPSESSHEGGTDG